MSEYDEFLEWLREEAQEAREVGRDLRASSFENTAQAIERLEREQHMDTVSEGLLEGFVMTDPTRSTDPIQHRRERADAAIERIRKLERELADANEGERKLVGRYNDIVAELAEARAREERAIPSFKWAHDRLCVDRQLERGEQQRTADWIRLGLEALAAPASTPEREAERRAPESE